jgi:hypothetical protein
MTQVPLIYVWIGNELPSWANDSLNFSRDLCGVNTILLTNKRIKKSYLVDNHYYIDDFFGSILTGNENFSAGNNFRDGFWIKTLERFLVLKKFMIYSGINKIFHAELDNIIFDISKLANKLDLINHGFFCPRDSLHRGIASLIYINDHTSLECFDNINLRNAGTSFNDMTFLGHMLKTSRAFHSLPTENSFELEPKNKWEFIGPERLGGIFDAASIGQYLFGVDKRNTFFPSFNGFINENSSLNIKNFSFEINTRNKLCLVNLKNTSKSYRLFNIHVHSKIFDIIKDSDKRNKIVNRINIGKKSLIKRNFGYGF